MIVVGTDFSPAARAAADIAANWARYADDHLLVVHVVSDEAALERYDTATAALGAEVRRLLGLGVKVEGITVVGEPTTRLAAEADRADADLIVLGALGESEHDISLGSVAERVMWGARRPVAVVRGRPPGEQHPARVLVDVDLTTASDAAVELARHLHRWFPAEVRLAHVYDPEIEASRARMPSPHTVPAERFALEAAVASRVQARSAGPALPIVLAPALDGGRPEALAALVDDENPEVLVIGAHVNSGWDTVLGSGSPLVALDRLPPILISVPAPYGSRRPLPRLNNLLVPVDFPVNVDVAVPWAFRVAPPGATIHLLHVSPPLSAEERPAKLAFFEEGMMSLVPRDAQGQHRVVTHVEELGDVVAAIGSVADRLDIDLIVIGTDRHGPLRKLVGDSISGDVIAGTLRPVLRIRPD